MKQFNFEKHERNLPDSFAKKPDSNNAKILQIERTEAANINADIQAVFNSLDLENMSGKTLDLLGEMYDQKRGLATDAQYRLMIMSKIMQNISGGDYKSVVRALCTTFNCSPSELLLKEIEGSPCTVELAVLPIDVINKAGLTISQTVAIVERLLPAGIQLKQYSFTGTFMVADEDYIRTDANGLASDDGTIQGGYLGTIGYMDNDPELPI